MQTRIEPAPAVAKSAEIDCACVGQHPRFLPEPSARSQRPMRMRSAWVAILASPALLAGCTTTRAMPTPEPSTAVGTVEPTCWGPRRPARYVARDGNG